jgi:polyphenol oxidase
VNPVVGHTITSQQSWQRVQRAGVKFHAASSLSSMPGLTHGFTTRDGGVSQGSYSILNMGSHVGDDIDSVMENRRIVAEATGFNADSMATAEQVHGAEAAVVSEPGGPVMGADALLTQVPGILLTLMFADCVPIFLFDPVCRVVGLVHSGWKGTEADIVGATISEMNKAFGCLPAHCIAAIGPCIGFDRYEVSRDVASRFRNVSVCRDVGSSPVVLPYNDYKGTYLLNLRRVVFQQLIAAGVGIGAIAVSDECTFDNHREFYSHRRDGVAGLSTGRMAAVIGLHPFTCSKENHQI